MILFKAVGFQIAVFDYFKLTISKVKQNFELNPFEKKYDKRTGSRQDWAHCDFLILRWLKLTVGSTRTLHLRQSADQTIRII